LDPFVKKKKLDPLDCEKKMRVVWMILPLKCIGWTTLIIFKNSRTQYILLVKSYT